MLGLSLSFPSYNKLNHVDTLLAYIIIYYPDRSIQYLYDLTVIIQELPRKNNYLI